METILTIGLPVYNDEIFLEQSIKSLLNQTYRDFILIISDDNSTDNSSDICKKYLEIDKRIKYIRQSNNLGISKNMQFLLSQAKTEFFMWAGDDDLYDKYFIEKLISQLKQNGKFISAFCDFAVVNENNEIIKINKDFNYTESNTKKRLLKFIKNANDAFGYGIFKTENIRGVEFPVWWWPNRKTPYNNIYPTLCYYLTKGDYIHINEILFYKREKSPKNTHHKLIGKGNAINESFSFWIRRFNLVFFSLKMIKKASSVLFVFNFVIPLLHYWFFRPSYKQLVLLKNAFIKRLRFQVKKQNKN